MTYSTRKEFKFIPELSVGDQSEHKITTINVPLISAYAQSKDLGWFAKYAADAVFNTVVDEAWVTKTPEEYIWGYSETLFDLAKTYLPKAPPMDNFGFFTKVCIILTMFKIIQKKLTFFLQCNPYIFD